MPDRHNEHQVKGGRKPAAGPKPEKAPRQVARAYFERTLAENEERCRTAEEDLLRVRAEFDNYRKRTDRERQESAGRASVNLIKRLIPIIDDFDRAIEAAAADEAAAKYAEGLVMIRAHFLKALEDEGVSVIEAEGLPFDPHEHEAIMQEASAEHEDEHVIEVLRQGYRLGDMVLRPAMVKISRNA